MTAIAVVTGAAIEVEVDPDLVRVAKAVADRDLVDLVVIETKVAAMTDIIDMILVDQGQDRVAAIDVNHMTQNQNETIGLVHVHARAHDHPDLQGQSHAIAYVL